MNGGRSLRSEIDAQAARLDEPLAYRPREAARLLGVDESTIRRWIASGRLRAVHPSPRATLIPHAALYELLDTAEPTDQEAAR